MAIGGIGGGVSASLGGLLDASKRLNDSASRVAKSGLSNLLQESGNANADPLAGQDVDPVQEAVNQKLASYDYKANLKALEAQTKMQKEVINILA